MRTVVAKRHLRPLDLEFDRSINFVLAMQLKATHLVIVLPVTTRPFLLPITSTLFSKLFIFLS